MAPEVPVAKSFGFNASAVAFGGLIRPSRGKSSHIKGNEPSAALSPAGGHIETFVKKYKGEKGVSFEDALTVVDGTIDYDGKNEIYTTTATSEIHNLNLFDLVTADLVTSEIQSQRRLPKDPDSIFTVKAKFRNLRVFGAKVDPALDIDLFQRIPTYREFVTFFSTAKNMKRFAPSFGWNPADKSAESAAALIAAATAGQPLASPEPIRCSLVTERVVEDGGQEFRQDGYSLVLEGVGTVHLAEMLIKPGLRRINMLRIELRKSSLKRPSARGGFRASADRDGETYNATVCSGEGNGSNSYP